MLMLMPISKLKFLVKSHQLEVCAFPFLLPFGLLCNGMAQQTTNFDSMVAHETSHLAVCVFVWLSSSSSDV